MKFRIKLTLCVMALLSLLFGAGGSLLISESFQDSLEREQAAAFASYRMVWSALQIVNNLDPYLDTEAIARTMEQLEEQNRSAWTALRLSSPEGLLYSSEAAAVPFQAADGQPEPGACLSRIADGKNGVRFLILSGAAETNGDILYLQTAHNISALYAARQAQQRTYLWVFCVLAVLCAILSYIMSRVLTAPLVGLSRASRAIASGNFSSRVRICSGDEIGDVSADFNAMAARMEETVDELQQAIQRQERFVGSFAHEMKTPMTSLMGYAELLREGTLSPEEQAEAAGYIYSEGRRLEQLSRKLLELLVLKRGDMTLQNICPGALVETLTEQLRPLYAARGIQLVCLCEEGRCLLEPDLVWSLLLNLTDNAQKAMERGGCIRLTLRMLEDGCRIQVRDNGRGIPEQSLERLTEAFYRVDKARSREQGGFGLGLSLCQEIVQLHHGSLDFSNRPEGGACVTVELRGGRL